MPLSDREKHGLLDWWHRRKRRIDASKTVPAIIKEHGVTHDAMRVLANDVASHPAWRGRSQELFAIFRSLSEDKEG